MTLKLLQMLKYVDLVEGYTNHSKFKFTQKYLSWKGKVHKAKLFRDSTFKMVGN